MNEFKTNRFDVPLNRFNPEVGGISYKYLGNVQKQENNHNSAVFDAPNLSQVPSSFLEFFLLGFPPTLEYRDHLVAIGVKIFSTVQEEYIFTSKEIRFKVVAIPGFFL